MSTRRKFLINCSAAVAAAVFTPAVAMDVGSFPGLGDCPLAGLSHADFAGQINTNFRVSLGMLHGATLKLVRAPLAPQYPQRLGRRPPADANSERFSLIFSGSRNELLAEGIHRFKHSQLGRFEIFISRVGPGDAALVRYQAVFNRPMPGMASPG